MIKGVPLIITKEELLEHYIPVDKFEERIIRALTTMTPRSNLYRAVKKEMESRGHWKNKNRGAEPPKQSQFTRVSMQAGTAHQVSADQGAFSDGL